MDNESVVIIGGGPSGLAAAYELVKKAIYPIILEKGDKVGGIARTETYKDYLFDIGGHRFFTKNEKIRQLWYETLGEDFLRVTRMSRIYYQGRYFNYPINFFNSLSNLGIVESFHTLISYFKAQLWPYPKEETFEQWISNRFGRRLYTSFFKTYTEKVWGVPCHEIQADWAAQRIKGLTLAVSLADALFGKQKVRSLIGEFDYPLHGPGMMWEGFQKKIEAMGGKLRLNSEVVTIKQKNGLIESVTCAEGGTITEIPVKNLISSAPITRLVSYLEPKIPESIIKASNKLVYRSFIIVFLVIDKEVLFPDQWLYIHSSNVGVSRIQNYKNWSKAMVPNPKTTSLGMEYFCTEGDEKWMMSDAELTDIASRDLYELGFAKTDNVIDSYVVRQSNAYPIYNKEYNKNLMIIREYLDTIDNLQTIGRSGMHRYNNMDHSMYTGILAARNVTGANYDLWKVNEDDEYLEESKLPVDAHPVPEKILQRTFARMNKLAFAIAAGSVAGLLFFLVTIWPFITAGNAIDPYLQLLSQYFVGYTVTVKGAFIAFGYSFFWGFLFGWLFAYLRNLFLGLYVYNIKKKSELLSLRDFIDHL